MLILLTAGLAQADVPEPGSRASLMDAMAHCCLLMPPEPPTPLYQQPDTEGLFLRMFPGFTRIGNEAYIGGTPMREQAIMLDGTNLLLEGREGPFMQRTGSSMARPVDPLPAPSVRHR